MFDHLSELTRRGNRERETQLYTLELRDLSLEQLNAIRKIAQMCGVSTSNRAQPADAEGE